MKIKSFIHTCTLFTLACMTSGGTFAQATEPTENDYYKIVKLPIPEGIVLEVGGMAKMPNGDMAISTRRGDVYIVENISAGTPVYKKFASGLHEILGLAIKDGVIYVAQRGELTKLIDKNGDGKAERYETVYELPISEIGRAHV